MKELENKLSSREVSEMMELRHDNLLQKIDKIQADLTNSKVSSLKYWIEGTYKDAKGEERKEYQITKRGCEFLAHKTTGEKGNLFTDKYMDKFSYMENKLMEQNSSTLDSHMKLFDSKMEQFARLTDEAKLQYKPSHKIKLRYDRIIKSLTTNKEEYNAVKDWVFCTMGIEKWEDTCVDDAKRIMEIITAASTLISIKKIEQLKLF